jgi:thiamine transport system permease protein
MDSDSPQIAGSPASLPARLPWRLLASLASIAQVASVLFILVFLLYPLGRILALGLAPLAAAGWAGLLALVDQTGLVGLIAFTTGQALLSTVLTLLAGLPASYVFARYDFPGKSLLRSLLTIPFVMPTVVVATAFVALIGSGGVLDRLTSTLLGPGAPEVNLMRTLPAVILAHVFYNVSVIVRIVGGFWSNLDPRLGEAATVLGASRLRAFRLVTLPLLLPAILAASMLVFAFCFTSFGVVLILGGPRIATLEVEIYRQAIYMFNLPAAAFLSLVQIVLTMAIMAVYSRMQARASRPLNLKASRATQRRPASPGQWTAVAVVAGGTTLCLALPLLVLAASSLLTSAGPGLDYWLGLFRDVRQSIFYAPPPLAIRNSLLFASATVGLSLLIGVPGAYLMAGASGPSPESTTAASGRRLAGNLAEMLFLLPLGTSAVTLGFGFIIALDRSPLDLRGSALLIPIAHTLVALPLVTRTLLPALRSMNPRWREAARMLGASPWQVWREIDLPIVARAALVAAAFAFAVSLGEFGATSLLTRPDLPTLPIVIFSYLGQPGEMNHGQALAMGTLLMIVCGAGLVAIERFRPAGLGEF